ncbi:hypothetical protein SAMN04488482_4983 [Pseudomonas chlororaphis]|nr:hypothetical protein C4K27_3243 [Pseudomonas chlororaphis subsp. chlororaphis]SMQ09750.1 hypothetical protein SAMN04488482_4983 [Pseudomonas chlororaphis]
MRRCGSRHSSEAASIWRELAPEGFGRVFLVNSTTTPSFPISMPVAAKWQE